MQGSTTDLPSLRDRIFTKNESDIDSINFSNFEQELNPLWMKGMNSRGFNYQTGTENEIGGITNNDESATDENTDFKSILQGIAGGFQKRDSDIYTEIKKKISQQEQLNPRPMFNEIANQEREPSQNPVSNEKENYLTENPLGDLKNDSELSAIIAARSLYEEPLKTQLRMPEEA